MGGPTNILLAAFVVAASSMLPATEGAESTIFDDASDQFTTGDADAVSCLTNGYTSIVGDSLVASTNKWHSGGLYFGCLEKNSDWQCVKSCYDGGNFGANPNFSEYGYLTFRARASGTFSDGGCQPTVGLGKRWPQYGSQVVELTGAYVDAGALDVDQWRNVVIPIGDFATDDWPTTDDVKAIWFRSCGTDYSAQPVYEIMDIKLTDDPPTILEGGPGDEPTPDPAANAESIVFDEAADQFTVGEPEALSCLSNGYTTIIDDQIHVATTKWHSGGITFGCKEKNSSWQCIKTCYDGGTFGANPSFSEYNYLTFRAKASGTFTMGGCQPTLSLGKRHPQYSSKVVELVGPYVDAGSLLSDEWRNVVIPTSDMISGEICDGGSLCWPTLDDVKNIWFRSCGTDYNDQPIYDVSDIILTNDPPALISEPPTPSPTPYVTVSPSHATHRKIHRDWFPLVGADREPAGNIWLVAENGEWPSGSQGAADHTVTVHIPQGQVVTYSGSDLVKYDKIVVEGELTIEPDSADVKLIVGTLLVEPTGRLSISTQPASLHTVTIEIDGTLDHDFDPSEMYLGLVSLEGSVTVLGKSIPTKVAELKETATAGAVAVKLLGSDAAFNWAIGDEFVLPDTQTGLDVGHWNFPNNEPNGYIDQTEIVVVSGMNIDTTGNTIITVANPLAYSHSSGSHAAHITRSVKFVTSASSTDQGHIIHTGAGAFDFMNARVENFGRSTTAQMDNTVLDDKSGLNLADGLAKMSVVHQGTNQISRYALHAHHSLAEMTFQGNAILYSPRNGIVVHNSRVHVTKNVVLGADGTGIFLEDSTETAPVDQNFLIGNGGGSRGGDDGRFSSSGGVDMAHGGFGIWARGVYAMISNNQAEGHFGVAPYAYFVHPGFASDKPVPDVPGTPVELVGKTSKEVSSALQGDLSIQSYGGFVNNTAYGTWKNGLDLSYFGRPQYTPEGHILENVDITALAKSGRGASTIHSTIFTMRGGSIRGVVEDNTITGAFCNNCNGCSLEWLMEGDANITNVAVLRGGNC